MALSNATRTILAELSYGPRTSYALSVATGLAQPSVRATIGRLRKAGYTIQSLGTGLNAEYRLGAEAVSQADGYAGDAFDTDIDAGDEYGVLVRD